MTVGLLCRCCLRKRVLISMPRKTLLERTIKTGREALMQLMCDVPASDSDTVLAGPPAEDAAGVVADGISGATTT